jgi:hypothetical protein
MRISHLTTGLTSIRFGIERLPHLVTQSDELRIKLSPLIRILILTQADALNIENWC